ncbi:MULTISPECIES: hypothetical protein [unclassified Streptomyces]|uniref:hypothetical protein n=1 Tax=unclassified Streptomyces TaxID=2593676 RepID=UPI002E37C3C9|nr:MULTISPECIES: hypothetical protein [unclassified Streptomyces]WUC64512.1 hypothetical protein OG861_09825 [Streptomyces sp. NBC_00539]
METTKTPAPADAATETPEDVTAADTTAGEPVVLDKDVAAEADETDAVDETDDETDAVDETDEAHAAGGTDSSEERTGGVGAAASAVVAAALGTVALSGSWVSRVAAERENLANQLDLSAGADNNEKIAALYSSPWHATALVNGVLATIALLVAVFVLARPAFGAPGRTLPTWVRSVAWAAVALAALGIVLFALMYFDVLLPVPTAPAQPVG